jgi:hypothetical protein
VRGRLKRLAAGATPAELQLGHDPSAEQCVALLTHLEARWCNPPRPSPVRDTPVEVVAGGIPGAYFRVAGRTFDRQDPLGRLTFQGAQHLQTLGALTDYDRNKEDAEREWPWERWQSAGIGADRALTRREPGHYRWTFDQLVVVRDDDGVHLGYVTRVEASPAAAPAVALRLWPGTARTVAMRTLSTLFSEEPPTAALLLPEVGGEAATLVVAPRTFTAGRVMRSIDRGTERKFRLARLVQRGADFERVAFEELT